MKNLISAFTAAAALTVCMSTAVRAEPSAEKYADTVAIFKHAGKSAVFFHHSYGYAIFPTIGEGAFIVGGAGGKGQVFVHGRQVGDVSVAQVSVGFQAGGQAYSEIIFFADKRSADEFMSGNFEFGADAQVVAITAEAGASAATNGSGAEASGGEKDARNVGHYYKGMAVFSIAKGGLMYQAAVSGQKFTFHPLSAS
jgi:lipid-binding SYLF domain-containing protein